MKNISKRVGVVILCCTFMLFSVGCGSTDKTVLSFDELSKELLTFDTDVRPFLSSLEYAYADHADLEHLSGASTSIKNLSFEMGESFKNLNAVMAELASSEIESTEVTTKAEEITIKNGPLQFFAKLNEAHTDMSVRCINGDKEYVYELKKHAEGGYLAQIVTKNPDHTTFTIYQLKYAGTAGKLVLAYTANQYVSIYEAKIAEDAFPSMLEYTFEVV